MEHLSKEKEKSFEIGEIYTKQEMMDRGASGYLSKAKVMRIPIENIEGLEPVPEPKSYIKGKGITQPIEVQYNKKQGKYILYAGNHRVQQAKINSQKTIIAFVEDYKDISTEFFGQSAKIPSELKSLAEKAREYESGEEFIKAISKPRKEGDASRTPVDVIEIRKESGTLADYKEKEQQQWFGEYTKYKTPLPTTRAIKFKIYRAVPPEAPNYILPGDYITQSRKYAEMHLDFVLDGKGKIIEGTATLEDITPINPNEFWYVPKAMEKFKDLESFWQVAQKKKQEHLT